MFLSFRILVKPIHRKIFLNKLLLFFSLVIATSVLKAQSPAIVADSLRSAFSKKYLARVDSKISGLNRDIKENSLKVVKHFEKQERKIQRKLSAKDSAATSQVFDTKIRIISITEQITSSDKTGLNEYIPEFDSLKTSLAFLNQYETSASGLSKQWSEKLKSVNSHVRDLENRLQQANNIKRLLKERRQQLKEQLQKVGLGKEFKKINKEVYYYQQQLNEYKAVLKDKKRIERQAMAQLRKLPAFNAFMKKNSQLASLFRLPNDYGNNEALAGLQTRSSVQSQLQARFAPSGVNPQQYIGQQMQQARGELNKIKDKLNKMGGGNSEMEMPGFQPNPEHTKSFFRRIQYAANIQSQKTNSFLPVSSDVALTAGYKFNDKSVAGVGIAYKIGWGHGWKNIELTNEGVGLRSFIDVKWKGSLWISGGYEQNYQRAFTRIDELKLYDAWHTSGLIGLSKKYKVGKKTNNLQLLWDFMSYRQVPKTQPVLFRIGYLFN